MPNLHEKTVQGFGDEWERFDQSDLTASERETIFAEYFHVFPWESLPDNAVGCDIGCGSGRWAMSVAPRIGHLHCIDPSSAIEVAKRNLAPFQNVSFYNVGVDDLPMVDASMDFGYSLGVLHHIPDTAAAMASCVRKMKPGAPFLVYLYYAFDNRPAWFRTIWKISEFVRSVVSRQPHSIRYILSQIIAFTVYWPLVQSARIAESLGANVENWPLSGYRKLSFYTMRTDALDRFGTALEQRFTRVEIEKMMIAAGLENIKFSDKSAFWCAVGTRTII